MKKAILNPLTKNLNRQKQHKLQSGFSVSAHSISTETNNIKKSWMLMSAQKTPSKNRRQI